MQAQAPRLCKQDDVDAPPEEAFLEEGGLGDEDGPTGSTTTRVEMPDLGDDLSITAMLMQRAAAGEAAPPLGSTVTMPTVR